MQRFTSSGSCQERKITGTPRDSSGPTLSRCMVSTTSGFASRIASTLGSRFGCCIVGWPAMLGANTVWYFQCARAKSARPLTMVPPSAIA